MVPRLLRMKTKTNFSKPTQNNIVRGFNSGRTGHRSDDCQDRKKGPKCFACIEFGHK